jgi:hypothetical protein
MPPETVNAQSVLTGSALKPKVCLTSSTLSNRSRPAEPPGLPCWCKGTRLTLPAVLSLSGAGYLGLRVTHLQTAGCEFGA